MNTEGNFAGTTGPANEGSPRSAENIEQDIDATRAKLDRTLDALQAKLSPRQRITSAADSVRAYGSRLFHEAGRVVSPDITTMIRMDHSHVLAVFRRFRRGISEGRKRALVTNSCLALEIHAQLEEEIFYPALKKAGASGEVLAKSVPEHDEMRTLIDALRSMEPGEADYDHTFRELMRVVIHHVADEEAILLSEAEELIPDRLGQLGMEMTKRRFELLGPHVGEVAATTVRSFPVAAAARAIGVLVMGWFLVRPRAGAE